MSHWRRVVEGIEKARELRGGYLGSDEVKPLTFLQRIDLALWGARRTPRHDNALSKRAALGHPPTPSDIERATGRMFYGRARDGEFLEKLGAVEK
ncbi:hypothetical protein [Pyruvatibacter mobilis]|uniref:hypothetical protein n=1 Tax=Pyruvatibacter mobilis TaxID=1712261 RepID=UPI003BAC1FDA